MRGADLLDSTPRQIYLQQLLGLPTPKYTHLPVVIDERGEKLSKQTHAAPIDRANPGPVMMQALRFLGQEPPRELEGASAGEILRWGETHWSLARVPRVRTRQPPS